MKTVKDIFEKPFAIPALILSLAIIISAIIGASVYKARASDDTLTVTGSTRESVTSDQVKWVINVSAQATEADQAGGYNRIKFGTGRVLGFLEENGIDKKSTTVSPVTIYENYRGENIGPREFSFNQTIIVNSDDVTKITELSGRADELAGTTYIVSTQSLEYFYSKLAEMRVRLLEGAIKDAKARAREIAKASGGRIGSLKSASSGVVQVMAPNSVEISDYGMYDTSSLEKDIMVTVRAEFGIQ